MKYLFIIFFALLLFVSRADAASMTTAERTALALDTSDAGYNVYDTDLGALMIWSGTAWFGYPLGVPYTTQVGENKIGIVAGTMRQSSADRTKWYYLSNSTTRPIGVSGTNAVASGSQITITYDTTYSEVLTGIVAPDEEWANVAGLTVGASVGLSTTVIKAASFLTGALSVKYNGSSWVTAGSGTSLFPTVLGYTNGTLGIQHAAYARGIGLNVTPWSDGGAITNPYMPLIKTIGNDFFELQWMDVTTGNLISSATPTNRQTAYIVKANNGGLFLDGSNGSTNFFGVDPTVSADISFFILLRK